MSEDIQKRIEALELSLAKNMQDLKDEFKLAIEELKSEAFPDSNLDDHHDTHKRQIDRSKEWSDNWRGLRKKIFEGAGYAFILFVAGAVLTAIRTWVKLP